MCHLEAKHIKVLSSDRLRLDININNIWELDVSYITIHIFDIFDTAIRVVIRSEYVTRLTIYKYYLPIGFGWI